VSRFQGLLGLVLIYALCILISRHRSRIKWRTLGIGFALQVIFAFLVLKWTPGNQALNWFASQIAKLIGFTTAGTTFMFGGLAQGENIPFAISVLPIIIFLGTLIGLLYYLRIIQWFVEIVGGGISWLLRTSKLESVWAATSSFWDRPKHPCSSRPICGGSPGLSCSPV
jgi:CNT family concentrative nucleoside transporter